jgi:hypothetical protein
MNRLWHAMAFASSLVVYACSAPIDAGDGKPDVRAATAEQQAAAPDLSMPAPPPAPLVGGDRDAHGCIASAGYQWCERTGRCERSWELAKQEGFSLDENGFKVFCSALRAP